MEPRTVPDAMKRAKELHDELESLRGCYAMPWREMWGGWVRGDAVDWATLSDPVADGSEIASVHQVDKDKSTVAHFTVHLLYDLPFRLSIEMTWDEAKAEVDRRLERRVVLS